MKNKIPDNETDVLNLLSNFAPLPPYELGFDKRNIILETSLILEKSTSLFLAFLLGISDADQSITLGNKNSAFSFKQKIDLLLDIGALSNQNKNKYQAFMEIRNTFMHNFNADSFTNCFKYLTEKKTFLIKLYPQDTNKSDEDKFRQISIQLSDDLLSLTFGIINKVITKLQEENIKILIGGIGVKLEESQKEIREFITKVQQML